MLQSTGGQAEAPIEPTEPEEILVIGHHQSLTDPTSTGSRLNLTSLETPASVAIIDGDEIRARGDVSVVDAASRATGIINVANPGNGNTALAARGFGGQGSVLQLVNGVRLFPAAGTLTFPTDPWNIETIEVLSGPASVLYGQGALGGAINILTKKPNRRRTDFTAEAGYGSQGSWHFAGGAGGPAGGALAYRVDASYRRSNGYVDRGDSKSVALSGAIDFFPHETVSITLRNDYGDVRPMRYFGTPLVEGQLRAGIRAENYNVADAIMDWKDNRTLLSLDWSPSRSFSVASVAYRLTSDRRWQNAETYCWVGQDGLCPNGIGFGAPGRVYRADYLGIRHQQEQIGSQGSATIRTGLFGTANNDLVVGFDVNRITLTYSHDFPPTAPYIEDEIDLIDPPPGLYQGVPILPRYKTHTNTYALFAEDRLKFGDRFSLVGGIRFERDTVKRRNFVYSPDGSISLVNAFPLGQTARIFRDTTWRIGAVYQPKAELSIYGQYSTGVDPLGTLTTYTTSASQFFFTNASGNQVEAGVKASFLEGRGAATIAAYKIVKTGLVAQRIVNGPIEQIGRRSSKGIEASLTLALAAGFGIDANGTLHRAEYDDFISGDADYSGNLPPGVPQRAANLWLTWRGLAGLEIRAGLRHVGRRFSDDANRFRVPSYSVVDGGVSYAISDRLAFDLRVYNLFDEDYAVSTYADEQWILGRPRSVDVSIRAGF